MKECWPKDLVYFPGGRKEAVGTGSERTERFVGGEKGRRVRRKSVVKVVGSKVAVLSKLNSICI